MKPVFKEPTIDKLRAIIESTEKQVATTETNQIIDQIGLELKGYQDQRENNYILYGLAALLLVLCIASYLKGFVFWSAMSLVVLIGSLLYYRVHEKALLKNSNEMKSFGNHPIGKINYLISGIKLKASRKIHIKWIASLFIAMILLISQPIFAPLPPQIFMVVVFFLIIIISYFVISYLFKQDLEALLAMEKQLQAIKNKYILHSNSVGEEE